MDNNVLIDVENLSYGYDYELFSEVSLSLKKGESLAIVGVSGSGKSTLMHLMSTLLVQKESCIQLFGKNINRVKSEELSIMKRYDLGIIFQSHYLFKGLSAYENLEIAEILSNQIIDAKLLQRLGIYECINQKITELSGGQQQRVSIARVLTKKPQLIFADEPTGNLDKETALDVMDLLFDYVQENNAGMVLVTHDNDLANKCTNVFKLENKKLLKIK